MITIVDVLDRMASQTGNRWEGNGFNLIAVPSRQQGPPFRLVLNPTSETLVFNAIKGFTVNRGDVEGDVDISVATYIQTVFDSRDKTTPIHREPGLWLHVPPTKETPSDTFVRQGVTPHGDCVLAQSTSFDAQEGPPNLKAINTLPFPAIPQDLGTDPATALDEKYLEQYLHPKFDLPATLLPTGLTPSQIIKDPATVLRAAIKDQVFVDTAEITISTNPHQTNPQMGILNIPFITSNANAVQLDAVFWVEHVKGASGQEFFQLQYAQRVILDFEDIHWPHVSVATLRLA